MEVLQEELNKYYNSYFGGLTDFEEADKAAIVQKSMKYQ